MEGVSIVGDPALVCRFGAFSNFLSKVPENYFLTHLDLLTTENHKPVVMLRVPAGGL